MEKILRDDLSGMGWRRRHVISLGKPVDEGRHAEALNQDELPYLRWNRWEEKGLGMHHLYMAWPARELVRCGNAEGVLWWRGESIWQPGSEARASEAGEWAAIWFRLQKGRWPTALYLREMPEGVASLTVKDASGEGKLSVKALPWLPAEFVFVSDSDILWEGHT